MEREPKTWEDTTVGKIPSTSSFRNDFSRSLMKEWRWSQSSANLSPQVFPCSTGKYREFNRLSFFPALRSDQNARSYR